MVKLNVQIVGKCPRCGKQLQWTNYTIEGEKLCFIYCPNSKCRYAEGDEVE